MTRHLAHDRRNINDLALSQINFNPSQNFRINYDFALKENLNDTSYELLGTELKINNFVSTFEYLNENNSNTDTSYLSNISKISDDIFSFIRS